MTSVTAFIRNTSATSLKAYFDTTGIALPAYVAWDVGEPAIVQPLIRAVDEMSAADRDRVISDANRVSAMADEAGRVALLSVIADRATFEALENDHDRALWVFLNDSLAFQQAEEVRFTDERRRGRSWDGFVGEPGLAVRRDPMAKAAFKAALAKHFGSGHVEVDVFERIRPTLDGVDCALTQVTVYREGLPDDYKTFTDAGVLVRRARRPAYEAAMTYEASTGVIEVVAQDRETRRDLVVHLARDLLGIEFKGERVPFRNYDLSPLLRPCRFETDAEDGIEGVELRSLRVMPLGEQGKRTTFECVNVPGSTVWSHADDELGRGRLDAGGYVATQAKLLIRFSPAPGERRGRTMPLTITMPHGCNLKDRTDREQLIGAKYLKRWKLLTEPEAEGDRETLVDD